MSLSNLNEITRHLRLTDIERIIAQGRAQANAGFSRQANPMKSDRDRDLWDRGFKERDEELTRLIKKWREADRSER